MGNYSRAISKRFQHTKIEEGFCLICGEYGRLTQDHVPPKGSISITKVEQRHIIEVLGGGAAPVRGVKSRNGSKFKTICAGCNNVHLGQNDDEIARVNRELSQQITAYFTDLTSIFQNVSVNVNALKYARAMAGHILAATSVKECQNPPEPSSYFDPIKQFVQGDDEALAETHDIYYWFYPYKRHFSGKFVGFHNNGHLGMLSVLSFFPIAFMITKKNEGTYPSHAQRLQLSDERLVLDLSSTGIAYAEFPFCGLENNQMMLLTDFQAIVSYPIGQ